MRIIKKYLNRRLYDCSNNSYITLDDVKQYVKERIAFKVIDAKSKKDLTQLTLLQIILEQETSLTPLFSTSVLEELIRLHDTKAKKFASDFFENALQLFNKNTMLLQDQWQGYQHYWENFFSQSFKDQGKS